MSSVPLSETAAKRRIGDILLDHGFVTAEELAEATLEQERTQQPLGQILVGRGAITRLELASALAEQWSDPAASIMSSSRSTPALAPAPSAQDEAQYAARLQEAVADLARKVQTNKPLEGIDERVDELSRRIEGTLARTQHIEAAVATLAESLEGVTTGVEEAFYALQTGTAELVDDLARIEKTVSEIAMREAPQVDGPSLADLEELRAAVGELESGRAATTELRDRIDDVAARLESGADPGTGDALARVEQLEALLERTTSDVAEVTAALGRHEEAAVDGRVDDLAHALEALRAEVAEVGAAVRPDEATADRLDALERRLHGIVGHDDEIRVLSAKLQELEDSVAHGVVTPDALADALGSYAGRELVGRFEALEARLADGFVTPENLTGSIERALNEREPPAVDGRVTELAAQVEALRAEIESRIDRLSQRPADDEDMARRIDELETARRGDLDTINVLAVAMDRIRHDLTTAREPVEASTADVVDSLATLAERVAALEEAPPVDAVVPEGDAEVISELERFRLMLERIGLHLGEHDRAIADIAPNRGVEERLQELTVLVHDLAASQQNALAPQLAGAAAPIPGDISTLLQRVEEAESASQTDNERLMNRLERMASSIDWRLQRLESDTPDPSE